LDFIVTCIIQFVTSLPFAPEEIWRDYGQRSNMESRIAELKYDLAADDFCLKEFFATEAAFRSILLLFNLLGEFQQACGMQEYRRPAAFLPSRSFSAAPFLEDPTKNKCFIRLWLEAGWKPVFPHLRRSYPQFFQLRRSWIWMCKMPVREAVILRF
jgi:hypothetical protein